MRYAPIDFFSTPSCPAPLISSRPVEIWQWGDWTLVVHRDAVPMAALAARMGGPSTGMMGGMFQYPMSVMVCDVPPDQGNPLEHTVAIVSFESSAISRIFRLGRECPMLTLVSRGSRQNFGAYSGKAVHEAVREACFELVGRSLTQGGSPTFVGHQEPMHRAVAGGWLQPGPVRRLLRFFVR